MGRYALDGSVGFRDIVGAAAKDSILATNIKQPLPGRCPFLVRIAGLQPYTVKYLGD